MKILMTGSHGFVGTNLIEALSSEHEIIRWDVRSDDVMPECDAIIHLAGLVHDTKNTAQEEEYFKVNTEQTKKIYDAFLRSKAKKFVFFSSIKAKDNDTPYARSKKAAEDYILNEVPRQARDDKGDARDDNEISHQVQDEEKKVYILRPCMIHGKGVKGNMPPLFKVVRKGWPWPLAAYENQRSYASMGNVSFIVKKLIEKDVKSGIFNICDDETISTNELIRLMNECVGQKSKLMRVPASIVETGAKIGDFFRLPLNTERLRKLTGDYVVDNAEIKQALGIDSLPVNAKDGMIFTIQEMMKQWT